MGNLKLLQTPYLYKILNVGNNFEKWIGKESTEDIVRYNSAHFWSLSGLGTHWSPRNPIGYRSGTSNPIVTFKFTAL